MEIEELAELLAASAFPDDVKDLNPEFYIEREVRPTDGTPYAVVRFWIDWLREDEALGTVVEIPLDLTPQDALEFARLAVDRVRSEAGRLATEPPATSRP